jgi:CRISPR/Cas system CSM-associated protein Csm2 small subunit
MTSIAVTDIVFRQDLYPRFEPDQAAIQRYSDSVEFLPPIQVNQNNILIDGFHRWKAYQVAGKTEIPCEVVETASEKELKRLAYRLNSIHGLQLAPAEKAKYAQEMYGEMTVEELATLLSVDARTVRRWTESQRKAADEERKRRIVELYLRAWNTQETVADIVGVTQPTIANTTDSIRNGQVSAFYKTFTPLLYNIWNAPKQDNARAHFGAFPEAFMENLLHYHTEPLDVVYDPFGGGGTTVYVCKRMFRRYYVTDRKVTPGREADIRQRDIADGLPDDLPKPAMAFLDPPYWKQAEGQYSKDAADLGNMSLADFNASMQSLLDALAKRQVPRIAIVIQPTQYKAAWQWTDHVFDFHGMLADRYRIAMRYILPYSTQQYTPQIVDAAKETGHCLCLNRDLVIWELRND